jgi:hypothetical protein
MVKGVVTSAVVALFVGFIAAALSAGGVISMAVVRVCLIAAFIVGTVGVVLSEVVSSKPRLSRIGIVVGVSLLLAASLYALDRWIEMRGTRPFTFMASVGFIEDDTVVQVAFKNDSDYPATAVTMQARWLVGTPADHLDQFDVSYLPPAVGSGNLGPHETASARTSSGKKEAPQVFAQILKGELLGYLYGQATYRNVDGTARYQSRFCVTWSAAEKRFVVCPPNNFTAGQVP